MVHGKKGESHSRPSAPCKSRDGTELPASEKKSKAARFFFWGEKKLTSPLLTTLSEKQMCNRFSSIFIHIWVGNHMEPLWSGFGDKLRQQLWQCHPATPKNPAEAQLQ
jgi:hypothetical protein